MSNCDTQLVPLSVRIPAGDKVRLQAIAANSGRSLTEVVAKAINAYLREDHPSLPQRIEMLEDRVNRLTVLVAGGAGGDRYQQAREYLDAINRLPG